MRGLAFAVGGHRGCGENLLQGAGTPSPHCPGIRENTIAAFRQAAKAGADFVEFDVQVTADGVPVLWHDDYVVHGSLCAPKRSLVSQLTLSELRSLKLFLRWFKDAGTHAVMPCDHEWHCQAEDIIPTLAEAFEQLPESLAFNIEIKMATSAALAQTPQEEVQRVVDPVLQVAAAQCGARALAVSSFDPDVMLYVSAQSAALRAQCADLSIWFLSSGWHERLHRDRRRCDVALAADVARSASMDGIVMETAVALADPTVVTSSIDSGLRVMTFGLGNNDVAWVLQQKALGVSGVIVDDVAGIVEGVEQDELAGSSPKSCQEAYHAS